MIGLSNTLTREKVTYELFHLEEGNYDLLNKILKMIYEDRGRLFNDMIRVGYIKITQANLSKRLMVRFELFDQTKDKERFDADFIGIRQFFYGFIEGYNSK